MSEQIEYSSMPELDEPVPSAAYTLSVGRQLQQAREARGLTVGDIAQALKLGPRQVEALERDEWTDLPGTTFIRGFVRNYARLVGVDQQPLMAHLGSLLEKPVDTLNVPEAAPATMRSGGRSRDRAVVAIGVGLVVVAVLAYFLLPNDLAAWRASLQSLLDADPSTEETAAVPAAQEPLFPPTDAAAPAPVPAPSQPVPAPVVQAPMAAPAPAAPSVLPSFPATPAQPAVAGDTAGQLRFHVARESWVEVRDRDDVVVFSQRLPAGSEQQVGGKAPLSVTIGYAPGVSLMAHGKVVDLAPHTHGDVARLLVE
ncbi:helix-turn-helix domain-containing protein [Azonexus sp.]|uniref:helix-turn-helix domain-containing protein n=1 Tax=Azonexus sp. TaxID=1872668 RepID=UPI0035AEA5AD